MFLVDVFGRWKLHFVTSSKFADHLKLRHGTSCFFTPVFCGSNSNFITVIWVACVANKSASQLHNNNKLNCDIKYDNTTVFRDVIPCGMVQIHRLLGGTCSPSSTNHSSQHKDGGSKFCRNVREFLPGGIQSHSRRWIIVFYVTYPTGWVFKHFGGTYCFHLLGEWLCFVNMLK